MLGSFASRAAANVAARRLGLGNEGTLEEHHHPRISCAAPRDLRRLLALGLRQLLRRPQALLNETFSAPKQIESGNVNLSLSLGSAGSSTAEKSLAVHLTGPFENAGTGKLPRFALQLGLTANGHALPAGATSTGSSLYVEIAGTWFSLPQSTYTALKQSYAQATKRPPAQRFARRSPHLGSNPASGCPIPPSRHHHDRWRSNTIHLTAAVDVAGFPRQRHQTLPGRQRARVQLRGSRRRLSVHAERDRRTGQVDQSGHRQRLHRQERPHAASPGTRRDRRANAADEGDPQRAEQRQRQAPARTLRPQPTQTIAAPSKRRAASQLFPALEQLSARSRAPPGNQIPAASSNSSLNKRQRPSGSSSVKVRRTSSSTSIGSSPLRILRSLRAITSWRTSSVSATSCLPIACLCLL